MQALRIVDGINFDAELLEAITKNGRGDGIDVNEGGARGGLLQNRACG
jgi:hypothetical protein